MEEKRITFPTAVLAKEKGFNAETCDYYRITGSGPFNTAKRNWNNDSEMKTAGGMTYISAPTQSLLQKWLREVHGLHIAILYSPLQSKYEHELYKTDEDLIQDSLLKLSMDVEEYVIYNSYEDALEAGLQEQLKKLPNQ